MGIVCIHIFGFKDPIARDYAIDLGLGMQLTNILRDIREDAEMDRVYLPQEELRRFGYPEVALMAGEVNDDFVRLMRFQVARARGYFDSGKRLLPLLPVRSRACPAVLGGLYSRVLDLIEQQGYDVYERRISLPTREKLFLAVRIWLQSYLPLRGGRRCVVIGGGLAGLSAACALADRGVAVTLLEKRPYLGGRAFSFPDAESGRHIDNGQHIYLACCTAYTSFLRKLGVLERTTLQRRLRAVIVDRDGRRGALTAAPLLPSPLHLLPSFLSYPHLGLRDKLRAATAMLAIKRTDRAKHRESLEAETFRDWLVRHGQSERAIAALWDLLTLPVFNDTVDYVSAYMGLMFFQDGMLAGRHSADIGVSRVGLTQLVADAACGYLEERGGEVLTGRNVSQIATRDGAVTGLVVDGKHMPANAVVAAVPWDMLAGLLPPDVATHPDIASADTLQWAPIINVHVWYDRPIIDEPFLAVLDSPLQWVFNRSYIEGQHGPRQHLCISVSGAWEHKSMGRDALRELFLGEMARVFPAAADALVERFTVIRQPNATFRCTPGAQSLRPAQQTSIAGLTLAGDWTQTGWPATMESAVRSGLLAAEAVGIESWGGGKEMKLP